MIPTPIESRDMAETMLEVEPTTQEPADKGEDCGQLKCYKYRRCWACVDWMGCKRAPLGTCFKCDKKGCQELTKETAD